MRGSQNLRRWSSTPATAATSPWARKKAPIWLAMAVRRRTSMRLLGGNGRDPARAPVLRLGGRLPGSGAVGECHLHRCHLVLWAIGGPVGELGGHHIGLGAGVVEGRIDHPWRDARRRQRAQGGLPF